MYRLRRSYWVFLGFVSTISAKNTVYTKHNKACLWYSCYENKADVLQSIQANLVNQYKTNSHYTEVKNGMIKVIDLVGQVVVPTDVVEGARQATLAGIQQDITAHTSNNPKNTSSGWYGYNSWDSPEYRHKRLVENIEHRLEKALMVPYGEKIEVPKMISDWLPNLKLLPKK